MKHIFWTLALAGAVMAQTTCPPEPLAGVENELTSGFPQALQDRGYRQMLLNNVVNVFEARYYDDNIARQDWSTYHKKALEATSERAFFGALREWYAALKQNDQLSEFFSPRQVASFAESLPRVGIRFAINASGQFFVTGVVPGGPADQAGVKPRDRVLSLDGDPCVNSSRFRGVAGSALKLRLQAPGEGVREVSVVRAIPPSISPAFEVKRLPANLEVGYLWLPFFGTDDASALAQALTQLQASGPLRGMVLDLRGGLVGTFQPMRNVLGHFYFGNAYRIVNNLGTASSLFVLSREPHLSSVPLAVLVDSSSSVLATWMAGILQKRAKAVVVGQPTQPFPLAGEVFPLLEQAELFIPTVRVEFPDGSTLPEGRVVPNVLVAEEWLAFKEADDPYIKAALEALAKLR